MRMQVVLPDYSGHGRGMMSKFASTKRKIFATSTAFELHCHPDGRLLPARSHHLSCRFALNYLDRESYPDRQAGPRACTRKRKRDVSQETSFATGIRLPLASPASASPPALLFVPLCLCGLVWLLSCVALNLSLDANPVNCAT